MLNSDTEVRPGAIERLVEVSPDERIGAVGRMLNPDGTPQSNAAPFPSVIHRSCPRAEHAYNQRIEQRTGQHRAPRARGTVPPPRCSPAVTSLALWGWMSAISTMIPTGARSCAAATSACSRRGGGPSRTPVGRAAHQSYAGRAISTASILPAPARRALCHRPGSPCASPRRLAVIGPPMCRGGLAAGYHRCRSVCSGGAPC